MINDRQQLEDRLAEVEAELTETIKRLPAHSIKPPVMMDLLALEDEKAELLQQLEGLQK